MKRHFNLKQKPVTLIEELPKQWRNIQDKLIHPTITKELSKGLATIADNLLQPEQSYDPLANEIVNANRKRKKKKKLGH